MIDLIGARRWRATSRRWRPAGRLVLVGLLGGGTATIDLAVMLRKRLTVVGTTLRARPLEEKIAVDPPVRRDGSSPG